MSTEFWTYGRRALLGLALIAGVLNIGSPVAAHTQEEPTCWAEWCENNTCIRIKIKCPAIIEPT